MSVYREYTKRVYEINLLESEDDVIESLSRERNLGLNLSELKKIKKYYEKEGRNPTDIELEAFAQSWSEHCCYKTSKPVLEKSIFKTKAPQNICVISEDAGVVDFDENHAYVVALESHNHPSALDPYGGAATGIGGILRDVVCMGAQPVALVDPLFFGPLGFDYAKLPDGVKHPQYLFKGVVSGISAYGNRVGIPTVAGMVEFDESYVGNCLVNVGCVGIVRKDDIIHSRAGYAGDVYILAGGKTGRDGIHGVTFASAELNKESEEKDIPAVQLGYAIMKEPLIHACLEANREKLLTGLKDFGGGGLSCVSAEMAHSGGKGATIYLDKIPLKEEGLFPWEIWVSESQERMMMTVRPEDVDRVLEIFDFWDVPAMVVGRIDDTNRIKALYHGVKVVDLDLDFLLKGVVYARPQKTIERDYSDLDFTMPDLKEYCMKIAGSARVGCKAPVIRRYDHEVRGDTVIKPLQGVINKQTHGDAAVIKPLKNSFQGLALTTDVNPHFCRLDPYWGAASAVEEVVRNLISVNSIPHSLADCLNFGNPEKADRLGDFTRCCEGLYYVASSFNLPFVSGNVSFYNESAAGSVAPTPTLLGVGLADDVRKCVSSDLKKKNNLLYLMGETKKEMGASEYYRLMGRGGGLVPKVDVDSMKHKMTMLLGLMDEGVVKSAHDLSTGGLFVALAEMCFGGDVGARVDLGILGGLRTDFKLFSESNGRWLIEVEYKDKNRVEKSGAKFLGEVVSDKKISLIDGGNKTSIDLDDLRTVWLNAVDGE
ncbi:MAG: phosphoribosylformylglycinamidine synthase II [Candidatus Altiarchaeales archaeon ex4484_96]|nr:MAG: phosphoribosylformylglycinamidine synthase II [Candidatus Altiarchaeales archaeon ex4484_96]